jgi:hypothetical protein
MIITLTKSVSSGKGLFYALEGEKVKVITMHHAPVLIVEDGKGVRFSCLIKDTDLNVETGKPIDQINDSH